MGKFKTTNINMTARHLILITTALYIVSCKEKNDCTINNVNGKVKTIEQTIYFTEEKFGEWKVGKKDFYFKFEFDENGFASSKTQFNKSDSIQEKTVYEWVKENEYDYYKHPTKKGTVYGSDGNVKEIEIIKYNFKEEESSDIYRVTTTFLQVNETLSVNYDFVNKKNGLIYKSLTEKYKSVGTNDSLYQFLYVTDYINRLDEDPVKLDSRNTSKGILIKGKHIDYFSSYLFDTDFEVPLALESTLKIQYLEFDEKKNWIKAVYQFDEKKNRIIVRKITYYK
jgi:hypothetical protein